MKYRDAVLLKEGDQVIRVNDNVSLIVTSIEKFGQFKVVKINYKDPLSNKQRSLFNSEIY